VEERERELLREKQNERGRGHMGVWGARAGPGRVGPRAGPKTHSTHNH
jgi:hypothetical protein